MLHYNHNEKNRGSVKYYFTRENSELFSSRPRRGKYLLTEDLRDSGQMGVTIDWRGSFNNFDYSLGYWFESSSWDLGGASRFNRDIKTMKIFHGSGGGYKTIRHGRSQIHNPFVKLAYSYEDFKVQAGLRYMRNVSAPNSQFKIISTNPIATEEKREEDLSLNQVVHAALLPTIGLGYKINKNLETYINYGRNYMRPYAYRPTFAVYTTPRYRKKFIENGFTYQDVLGAYQMETSDNFDLGFIYNDKKLRLNAGVYYSKQRNVLVSVPSLLPGIDASYRQNVGKLTSYGGELETYYNFTRNLTLFLHPSYTRISYDNNIDEFVTKRDNKGKPVKNAQGLPINERRTVNLKGNQSPATPKYMVKTGVLYNYKGLNFKSMLTYTGERYGDALNKFKVPSYTLLDAGLNYKFPFDESAIEFINSVNVGFEVKNVLNSKYIGIINASDVGREGRASYGVGFPRAFIGSVKIDL